MPKAKICVVSGAPCSGKTTYVQKHIKKDEIVFDADWMRRAVTYRDERDDGTDAELNAIFRLRGLFPVIANDTELKKVWIIATTPSKSFLDKCGDDVEIVNIEATEEECLERLENDDTRKDKEFQKEKIKKFFHGDESEDRSMPSCEREIRSAVEFRAADSDEYIVEGYATTFNDPYEMMEYDGVKYFEEIDRHAFDEADMNDVIFQYDHSGKVYARQKNGTLFLSVDDHGLRVRADLSKTEASRQMYEEIKSGLVSEMSFAFTVKEDSYDNETRTRKITKIKKVYDVSAVSIPANPSTEISARDYFNGVIEAEKAERLLTEQRNNQKAKIKLLCDI